MMERSRSSRQRRPCHIPDAGRAIHRVVLALVLLLLVGPSIQALAPEIRFVPPTTNITVGQQCEVVVILSGAPTLSSLDMQLHFNPSVVQVVDDDAETPDIQVQRGEVLPAGSVITNRADNATGQIDYEILHITGGPGEGTVITITLQAVGVGTSNLTFNNLELFDTSPAEVVIAEGDKHDGTVIVGAASATDTPTPTETTSPTDTTTPTPPTVVAPTDTATATATSDITETPTATETPATIVPPTETLTPTIEGTPTVTNTPTFLFLPLILKDFYVEGPTATPTDTPTITPTPTTTATEGPTYTPSPSPTASNTPTITATPTSTFTPWPTPWTCYPGLHHGDFEGERQYLDDFWIRELTPRQAQYTQAFYHGGEQAVRLGIEPGDTPVYAESTVRQQFTIPADVYGATLTFWWWRGTEESPLSGAEVGNSQGNGLSLSTLRYPYDLHEALLLASNHYSVVEILERTRANDSGWVQRTFDLTPYRGRTLVLYFNAYNNDSVNRTWMYVDDVELEFCVPVSQ